jgi:hypothetical protein
LLTGADSLYDNVFGVAERELDALLNRYDLAADITAGDYMSQIEAWFDGLSPADLSALLTVTQGGAVSPLLNSGVTIASVAGYAFTLHGPGFTVDVSVTP